MSKGTNWEFKSKLEITGSCGAEQTHGVPGVKYLSLGLTKQAFQVTDHKNGQKVWLDFKSVGAGGSVGKPLLGNLSASASSEDFFSVGSHFYGGIMNYGEVELNEIVNRDALIYSGSAAAIGGGGVTVIFVAPIPLLPFPVAWHSIVAVAGLTLSSGAGAGLMQYYGMLTRSSK